MAKKSKISQEIFHNEQKAIDYLEKQRWPNGPVCPHCSGNEKIYDLKGEKCRPGLKKCGHCRKQFTVKVGTLFEKSRIPIHKWLQATYLLCASKKGMSTHQLHRILGITYKSAWFMTHRIREAMYDHVVPPMGGNGSIVEAGETFWGNKKKKKPGARGYAHIEKIFSLVERGGRVRSFHVEKVTGKTLKPIIQKHVKPDTHIMTDDMRSYRGLGKMFDSHNVVRHSKGEYSRGIVYTNTIESYFSILKRGLIGTYHHCGPQHLKRYVGEFDFRYNHRKATDIERYEAAIKGFDGKRFKYRDSRKVENPK